MKKQAQVLPTNQTETVMIDETTREQQAWRIALQMEACQKEAKALEARTKELKKQLEDLYPDLAEGVSPPCFTVSIAERVEILDQTKAVAFFLKHKDLQGFFKLSINKEAYLKMRQPIWATLKASEPSVKLNQKKIAEVTERLAAEAAARLVFEADNPVNRLAS